MIKKISYLGLGTMGSGMTSNLLKAGYQLTVWNRSAEPAQANHLQAFDRFDPLVYAETLDALSASARADQNPRLLVRVR
jgi:3-hydroxyisobutyrate dehydrogenase-like beta-hydroxyacid dehydrogenase